MVTLIFRSPEPQAHKDWSRAGVCLCVNTFKHEYLRNQRANQIQILSEASFGWGKAALCFGPDQIGTLVSMATDISHRVIMRKSLLAL